MAPFLVLAQIEKKLREKHQVEIEEVREAFYNCTGQWLEEKRAEHEKSYKKEWTISESDSGRLLKLVLAKSEDDQLVLISAYEPDDEDIKEYETESKKD